MSYGQPEIISQLTQIILGLEKKYYPVSYRLHVQIYVEKKFDRKNITDRPKSEETWDVVRTHKKQ